MIKKIIKTWLPSIFWAVLIFFYTNYPKIIDSTKWNPYLVIAIQVIAYIVLLFLIYRALKKTFKTTSKYLLLIPFSLSTIYSIYNKIHYVYVLGKHGNYWDVVLEVAGMMVFLIYLKYKKGKFL